MGYLSYPSHSSHPLIPLTSLPFFRISLFHSASYTSGYYWCLSLSCAAVSRHQKSPPSCKQVVREGEGVSRKEESIEAGENIKKGRGRRYILIYL